MVTTTNEAKLTGQTIRKQEPTGAKVAVLESRQSVGRSRHKPFELSIGKLQYWYHDPWYGGVDATTVCGTPHGRPMARSVVHPWCSPWGSPWRARGALCGAV